MKKFKKPSPRPSAEKKSSRSIKDEVCRETMASKYLTLVDKNKNLTRLMKKFITDPNSKMKSVCQSYYYHSNLANSNFQSIHSHLCKDFMNLLGRERELRGATCINWKLKVVITMPSKLKKQNQQ